MRKIIETKSVTIEVIERSSHLGVPGYFVDILKGRIGKFGPGNIIHLPTKQFKKLKETK